MIHLCADQIELQPCFESTTHLHVCMLLQGPRLTFQLASPVGSDRFDSLAKTCFHKPDSLISIITSSLVNASLCSLQYVLNEQLASTKFSHPWLSLNRDQNFGTGAAQKHFLLSKYRVTIFANKIIRFTLILSIATIGIDVIIIGIAQQRKPKFTSVRNSHRISHLVVFTISHEHNNLFYLKFIYELAS